MMQTGQRIAVIGSGIAGLTAAHLLSRKHEVSVFEANDYIGGHTHTVPVSVQQGPHTCDYDVDTGFIVCNDRNYPNFLRLLDTLGVGLQKTQMSFSVANPALDLEYNGHNLDTLFAQRRNLLRPAFIRFVRDLLRFNKAARAHLAVGEADGTTLDEFLAELQLTPLVRDNYVLPMVAAIWSCSVSQAGAMPLDFFLRFFSNHGLLDIRNRPQWYVLKGGSHSYIAPLTASLRQPVATRCAVRSVRRIDNSMVEVSVNDRIYSFDQVILAAHSDQSLAMLAAPTRLERQILGDMPFQANDVVLHTDSSLMPVRKKAWASWNFRAGQTDADRLPVVTYCMNILQGIGSIHDPAPLLVSLNATDLIDPNKVVRKFRYHHPLFSIAATRAQARRSEICGTDRIHFCGAYWYNGFHEDGVRSALDVCSRFGVSL